MLLNAELRVLFATSEQFDALESKLPLYSTKDAFLELRGALSLENEFLVLKALAQIARVRLASFENSYLKNVEILKDEEVPMFTNYRNSIVLVRKEHPCEV